MNVSLLRLFGPAICLLFASGANAVPAVPAQLPKTWTADNGNGTFTNPLFYDEFSDPDLIRVGNDFYLTGTTMHTMPGLPILHSVDLVNWELLCYAVPRLDLGPAFRLEEGGDVYGQGIWAPSFRYHKGTFYIFSNVNHYETQLFTAKNPAGPWTHKRMKRGFHDLSVLFDEDDKAYIIWGYQDIHVAQLNEDLTDIVPGTEKVLIKKGSGIGEGLHWQKIDGKYYIFSAWYAGRMRMPAARSATREGPYEVNLALSADEDFGLAEGYRLWKHDLPFQLTPPNPEGSGHLSMHQGAIVDTPAGEWWGFSMMDANSVGRLLCLSPISWKDGWPYFGLPGNLQRTPRTWLKPKTGRESAPHAPYTRDDDFSGPSLANVWQWNHAPVDDKWSLAERPGYLRLHSLPAKDFWRAKNSLTQRAIGPRSTPTAELDASGLRDGDIAGLALLNLPYAWLGVRKAANGWTLEQYDQYSGKTSSQPLASPRLWLRAQCDFLTDKAVFLYSTDGVGFERIGGEVTMPYQLKTFQGVRYALFHYNDKDASGGYADFASFSVEEPNPRGLMRPIPYGKSIRLSVHGSDKSAKLGGSELFEVVDRGAGRVALKAGEAYLSVDKSDPAAPLALKGGEPGEAETFQWAETFYGDLTLLSLANHRLVRLEKAGEHAYADSPGPRPDRKDGACLDWTVVESR